jgi:hypothetical protein
MHKFILYLFILLVALLRPTELFAACAQLDGMRIPALNQYLVGARELQSTKAARHIEPLKSVYARIASVANVRPALIVCSRDELGFNAEAKGNAREGAIIFDLPMLEFLDDNVDEIAAVMAHEFAHLLLDHQSQKVTIYSNLTSWAKAIAWDRYQRTGDAGRAVQSAEDFKNIEFMKFSRAVEREADDKGFSLAVTLAKFSGDGLKNFARKLSKLPPSNLPPYLDDHPGWLERFEKADLLALNQHYMDSAQALFAKRDLKALSGLLKLWLRLIPASGAAWYYEGRILAHTSKNPSKITRAFEEAASLYAENPVLGVRSQEDQAESGDVWSYLCLALFDEGYKYESANCSRRITNEVKREQFKTETFGGLLIVAGNEQPTGNHLLVAREPDGSKLFTNDVSIAASRGAYKPVSPVWKAIRYPESLPR